MIERTRHKKIPAARRPGGCDRTFSCLLSEVIVEAGAQRSEPGAVGYAGTGEIAVGEIDVEIFDLGGPVVGKAVFDADACGPARVDVALREMAECLGPQFAECQAAGAIDQEIVENIARPAAHRAEPRIGELPGREGIIGAGSLDVAFEAEHPRTQRTTRLPVVAGLNAADETRRPGRVVLDRAPGIAEVAAEIGAGPAI